MHTKSGKFVLFPFIALTLSLTLFLTAPSTLYAKEGWVHALAKDISDRAYEPAVIKLLDEAAESIVVSMYSISLASKARNPMRLLFEKLWEARKRDVEVTIHLNSKFRNAGDVSRMLEDPLFKRLKEAGGAVYIMPSARRIHDKLIIVDRRYIVEGSTNWSISGLRDNYESATLTDSPELAEIKLSRLEMRHLVINPKVELPRRPVYRENFPQNLTLSQTLLLDKNYFPQMVTHDDHRSFDLYLLLLAHSRNIEKKEFFISMEVMALSLGMPESWSDTALRRQVIKVLRKLEDRYNLIRIRFFHSKDAWIELVPLTGDTFSLSSKLIKIDSEKDHSMRLKFILLVKSLLESQEEDIYSIPRQKLARRFHIDRTTISEALKELKEEMEKEDK